MDQFTPQRNKTRFVALRAGLYFLLGSVLFCIVKVIEGHFSEKNPWELFGEIIGAGLVLLCISVWLAYRDQKKSQK